MFLHHLIAASPCSTDNLFWLYNKYFLCALFVFQSWQAVVVVFPAGSLPYKVCFSSIVDISSYIQSLTWGCHLVLAGWYCVMSYQLHYIIFCLSRKCSMAYFYLVIGLVWAAVNHLDHEIFFLAFNSTLKFRSVVTLKFTWWSMFLVEFF